MFEHKPLNGKRPVTNQQLDERLRSFRWEVRFWIIAAIAAAQIAPTGIVQAAAAALPW